VILLRLPVDSLVEAGVEEFLEILCLIIVRLCVVFGNGLHINILQKSIAINGIGIAKGGVLLFPYS
jgi:hypothetical protein